MTNKALHQSLKERCMTVGALAALVSSNYSQVSQVLNNKPGRGGQTRRKLARILTAHELTLVGWDAKGNVVVPRGTSLHVTQSKFIQERSK